MSNQCNNNCESCGVGGCADRQSDPADFQEKPHELSLIKKVIGIVSGKGGVGKSLVTSQMAVSMQRKGYRVGILDADVTGPSIPKVFGLKEKATGDHFGIYPVRSKTGIEIISLNLLLENDTDPVVWRGPVIAGTVKQFWTDVIWHDIDYLFIDMPPGTGDVPLTVFQSIPVDGIMIVTSPQELVSMIVEKAVNMADMMNVPVLGIVENMSYFECPDCGKKHYIFGAGKTEEAAARHQITKVAKIPIQPEFASLSDQGRIEDYSGEELAAMADMLENI